MDSYTLSRTFFNWCFENPEKISPNHIAIYFFAIEHCNRLGWKKKFGFPTSMAMEAVGIKGYNTYIKSFNELIDWGFIELIEKSKNQYSSNIIALSKIDKAPDKALDKALIKHLTKHSESTGESIDSIDKQGTIEQGTIEQGNKEQELNTTSSAPQADAVNDASGAAKINDPPETVGAAAPPKTGKKEPFRKPEKKPKPEPLHAPCKKIFMDFFKDRNGVDYYWRGRDGKAINSIIKQLRGRGTGDTEIPDVFKTILNKIEDKWMLSNLDVSLLDSKFNQVITKIKNETKQLSYEEIKSEFKRRAEQHG